MIRMFRRKVLECDCMDVAYLGKFEDTIIHIWLDDVGLMVRNPRKPLVYIEGRDPLCGYGLVLGCDGRGETISLPDEFGIPGFLAVTGLRLEDWQRNKIDPIDYVSQLTRLLEIEMKGDVVFIQ